MIELFFSGVEKIIFIRMVCKYSLHQCAHELSNCHSCKYMVQWLVIIVKEPSSETINVSYIYSSLRNLVCEFYWLSINIIVSWSKTFSLR